MPARSAGCATCRKRKIRCDETRPGCKRCMKHGVPCTGYRLPPPGQVEFRDETENIVSRAHKPYAATGKATWTVGRAIDSHESTYGGSVVSLASMEEFNFLPYQMILGAMSPTYLHSPAMEKSLIYCTFLDLYLPKRMGKLDTHFSFLQHVIKTPDLRPTTRDALDALSMVQVGAVYNNKDLVRQAIRSYSRALSGLIRTMTAQDFLQDDYILATVTILMKCELYNGIAQVDGGWTKHIEGAQQILAARGPDSIQDGLALMLYSDMRHGSLSHGLIARRATFMGTAEWRAVTWRVPHVDKSTTFYDTALQVPAVLERTDKLDADSHNFIEEVDSVLKDSMTLQRGLEMWIEDFKARSTFKDPRDQELFWMTKITNFTTFTSLCSDRAIDEAFMFPSFMVAYLVTSYWDVMYFLRTTIQKLHQLRHQAQPDWFPEPDESVTDAELSKYVMDMCRCFPFLCEPISSSTGQIGMFLPLRTAALHFMQHGHWDMLKWLASVRNAVFVKGVQPPSMQGQANTLVEQALAR